MSFISVEPQSRVFLESHSNNLLAQFDIQLEIIADRYLAFFQERRSIEATYIDSLQKLHHKAKIVDASFDPRAEPTTTRTAWDKVRDSLERETDIQQAFVDTLDNDVIKPLANLKEREARTRKRVQEDLGESSAKYADHAENKILKLQEAYLKKYHPRVGGSRQEDSRGLEPTKSKDVSDDYCRWAISHLNTLRLKRVENLVDGYDLLEEFVYTPTIKNILVRYMDGMTTAHSKYDKLATNTKTIVEKSLAGTDTSDLRASFRRSLSFSIPLPTLYRNYRPGAFSDLIFGVPLADLETNEDNVPKLIRMCIEEVERRGLNANKIYSVGSGNDPEVLQLRRRFESEKSFSFISTDNIHSVATLLKRYLWDLPESLLVPSLRDYRHYTQHRARYTENGFPVLRSKISELHPVHRASLGALLRHLLRVSSHSDKNAMTVEALAAQFCYTILRGNAVLEGGVHVKQLFMEDLIQNAHILFDESPPPSPPVISFHGEETTPVPISGPFLSPETAETRVMGSTSRHRPGLVCGIPASTQVSFSATLLSPLLGLPSSQTPEGGVETTTQEQVIPEARDTHAEETLPNSSPPGAVSFPLTYVDEWRLSLPQPQLHPHPEAPTIPQSPPESVLSSGTHSSLSAATLLSSTTDFSLLPAAGLQSELGTLSPSISERF